MKSNKLQQKLLSLLLLLVCAGYCFCGFAQTSRTVLQPQFGKQTVTIGSNETITFYDPWGADGYFEYGRHNSHSLTVFRPEDENMAVVIKFEYIDIHSKITKDEEDGQTDIYEGEVNVYDGDPDAADSWTWATAIWDVHNGKSLPETGMLAHFDGTYDNRSFASSTTDGALSVGLFWRTANNSDGWKATVTCVPRNNMQTISAGVNYSNVAATPQYKSNVALGSIFINTEGVLNADHFKSVSFQFTRNNGLFSPSLLRIYRGEGTYFNGKEALPAYFSEENGTYTLTLDETLTTGNNTFTIVGDILSTAPYGGKASLAVTKITTNQKPNGVRPFDKGTPVTITNPAVIMLATGSQAVTIGDTPVDFYDDGGPNNDVTPGFEGSITFIPETSDKKIRINFKTVSLSTGSMRYQQINIYNGKNKEKENLIGSLKYAETGIFNSTADDGSITVEFLSNETMQTSSGFHAVVTQEIPNAMELIRTDVMQGSEDPVCAGDTDQPIMKFNLYTENTIPALSVSEFRFDTNNTFPRIAKATLFYSGKSSELNTSQKVGEVNVTANNFTIIPTTPVVLSEHNNYFTLCYDINDEAEYDSTVDANFLSIKIGGKDVTISNGSSKGNRTVENIVYSYRNQGTVTKIVGVDLNFESKDEFSNQHAYEAGDDNRINIFIPKHEGKVCQIDFSEFLIQYVEGYEGAHKSKFEIYSGHGNNRQLVWQLNSVDLRDKGPGQPIRSSAADGSLTIVFNPNDALGYYVAPGFKAKVSEYSPSVMTLNSIEVSQTSTDVVNNGTTDAELLTMNVKTVGNLSTINMQGIDLDLKDCQSNIKKISVYYTGKNDLNISNGALVATAIPTDGSTLNIAFTTNVNLIEGNNYFRIVADVADDAPTGSIIDAKVNAIRLDGASQSVENGDPEGQRTVKNITPKDMEVLSLTTASFANGNARKGETDVVMLRIDLNVEGENKLLTVESLNFEAQGGAIENIKVYQTGLSGTFSPANIVGQQSVNDATSAMKPYTVNGRYVLSEEGIHYLWAVCDIRENAKVGETFALSLKSMVISGTKYNVTSPQTTTMTIVAGKQGTITVGTEGDYATIQAAVDAISEGIDGAVTIEILPGIYNERVNVPYIKGASERNPIVIKGISTNPRDVRIYHNSWEELPYTDDRMAREFGLFTFDGANYVTLQNVEITTTALTYPSLIHLKNAARHITIDNCYVHTQTTTSNLEGVNLIYGYAKNEANQNNDYLSVTNCELEGGYIGVNLGGTSYVNLPKEVGGIVEGNIFREQGFKAIYVMDELGATIRKNKIFNTTSYKGNFSAIDIQIRDDYDKPTVIEQNTINMYCPATAYGLYLREMRGTTDCPILIINNEIIFANDNSDAYPIFMTRPMSNINIAHNTIITKAASGATMWMAKAMEENVNIVNNILQSNSTHEVINLGVKANATAVNFANNIYYTNGEYFARASASGEEYSTFNVWNNNVNDQNSIYKQVVFLSNELLDPADDLDGDLLKAQFLQYVSTDITGTERSSQPSIGAYEYDKSTDAPAMLDGYPIVENITDTSADVMVSPDKNVIAYTVVCLQDDVQPTIDELLTSDSQAVIRRNDTAAITVNGLTTGETYVAYVVLRSMRGQNSIVYKSNPFKAEGFKLVELPTPVLSVTGSETINSGETATLTATIESGTAPYTITWRNGKHAVIAQETLSSTNSATLKYQPAECDDYFVTVADKYGKTDADTFRIIVKGEAVTATFENLYVDDIGYYNGRDLRGSFVSGSYLFESNNLPLHSYWYGFAYSNSTSTTFSSLYPDQFNNAVGGGRNGSENYVVAFPEDCHIKVMNKPADKLKGFYITNNAFTLNAILNEDGITDGCFAYGDYLRLTVIGTHSDGSTSMKHVYLADYQSTNDADHYALDSWQWVDLRSLGEVETLSFKFLGTRNNSYGLTTPAYFCIDDFNGERDIIDGGTLYNDMPLNLSSIFDYTNNEATITYWIDEETSNEMANAIELSAEGVLKSRQTGMEGSFIIGAMQRGQQQFARINLSTATAIDLAENSDSNNISGAWTAIYNVDGSLAASNKHAAQSLNNTLRQLKAGIYIIKMNDGRTKKVTVGKK